MSWASERLAAEQRARVLIDRQLTGAGWVVQDRRELNLFAGQGVAVREVIMARGHGRADYLIYIDQKAVGVIEAKPAGTTLSGVEWQSSMYAEGLPAEVRLKAVTTDGRLPFVFEASGSETHFTNGYDPNPRARRVFAFPQPATLARTLRDAQADPEHPTWRGKVTVMPELNTKMLRPAQITADSPVPAPRSTTSGAGAPAHCMSTSASLTGGCGRAASYSAAKPANRATASGMGCSCLLDHLMPRY